MLWSTTGLEGGVPTRQSTNMTGGEWFLGFFRAAGRKTNHAMNSKHSTDLKVHFSSRSPALYGSVWCLSWLPCCPFSFARMLHPSNSLSGAWVLCTSRSFCGHDPQHHRAAFSTPRRSLSPRAPGDPLITYAEEEEGVSGAAAPLVVWLLAFSLAALWNVAYAVYLLSKNETWAQYAWVGWSDVARKFRNVRERA